nr:hypothetical protein CFP56_07763 [Quercus suber]
MRLKRTVISGTVVFLPRATPPADHHGPALAKHRICPHAPGSSIGHGSRQGCPGLGRDSSRGSRPPPSDRMGGTGALVDGIIPARQALRRPGKAAVMMPRGWSSWEDDS